jgi:hypothetical protein
MRTAIGAALLAFQVFMIGYARFVPSRYFCWAPYDIQTEYKLEATVNGKRLNGKQIQARYHRPKQGADNRSPQHVIDMLQGYEESYGRGDRTEIVMKYRVNGKEEQEWRWPVHPGTP